MTPLVTIHKLCKSFPGVRALHNAQLELVAGEVHALMGENGAGKSTLMKILAGVYQKDSGEICMDGQAVEIASPRAAQALVVAGKILAMRRGQAFVSPDDIRAAALPALRHRLLLNFEGEADEIDPDAIVHELVSSIAP